MSLKSIATFCVTLFVSVLGFLSPAFAQEEIRAPLALTINWPTENTSVDLRVVLIEQGGNCPPELDGQIDYSEQGLLLYWFNRTNGTAVKTQIGDYFTLCSYVRSDDGKFLYVLGSLALDIKYREAYEYTPVLPPAPPVVPLDTKRPKHDFEPASTVLIGTTVFPGWPRLTPLASFMVVPRSVQLGKSNLALKPVAYWAFLLDNPSVGAAIPVADLGAGALVGGTVNPDRKIQVHGDAGLMIGHGPAVWGCNSNTVSNPDDLLLTCQPGDAAITLRQQAWWFAPTLALSADLPVGKEGLRLGLGVTIQLRLVKGYEMLPNLDELQVEVVASDGNTYDAHYELANDGWMVTVPIIPALKLVWP